MDTIVVEAPNANTAPVALASERGDRFAYSFKMMLAVGFGLIIFYAVASLALTVWSLNAGVEMKSAAKAMFMVRLVQISLGMMIGFFTVFLGVLVAWMGIESNYRLSGTHGGSSMTLASASPGILLIICGTILLIICLTKPMEMSVTKDELIELLGHDDEPASGFRPTRKNEQTPISPSTD